MVTEFSLAGIPLVTSPGSNKNALPKIPAAEMRSLVKAPPSSPKTPVTVPVWPAGVWPVTATGVKVKFPDVI